MVKGCRLQREELGRCRLQRDEIELSRLQLQEIKAMKGLVTYGDAGELFLLHAAGHGEKLGEPTKL